MVEVVASIVALSTFGVKLTDTLYTFGSNYSAARAQTNKISDRITDYTTILDILEATVEADRDIFSRKAVDLIQRLCDQSEDLFYDIHDLLPDPREGRGRDGLSFLEKVIWNFRKGKVELLLGEIEYVKTNILLLLMTALVGKKIRSRQRRRSHTAQTNDEKDDEDVRKQSQKARNAIVQHMNAAENLEKLQAEAVKTESNHSHRASDPSTKPLPSSRALMVITTNNEVLSHLQQAVSELEDPDQRQAVVIYRSPMVLQDLLMQWTTVETLADNQKPATEDPFSGIPPLGHDKPDSPPRERSSSSVDLGPGVPKVRISPRNSDDDHKSNHLEDLRFISKCNADAGSEWAPAEVKLHPDFTTSLSDPEAEKYLDIYRVPGYARNWRDKQNPSFGFPGLDECETASVFCDPDFGTTWGRIMRFFAQMPHEDSRALANSLRSDTLGRKKDQTTTKNQSNQQQRVSPDSQPEEFAILDYQSLTRNDLGTWDCPHFICKRRRENGFTKMKKLRHHCDTMHPGII